MLIAAIIVTMKKDSSVQCIHRKPDGTRCKHKTLSQNGDCGRHKESQPVDIAAAAADSVLVDRRNQRDATRMDIQWVYDSEMESHDLLLDGIKYPISISEYKGEYHLDGYYKGEMEYWRGRPKGRSLADTKSCAEQIIAERYDTPQWVPFKETDYEVNTEARRAKCWACETWVYAEICEGKLESTDNYGSETMPCCWMCDGEIQHLARDAIEEFSDTSTG